MKASLSLYVSNTFSLLKAAPPLQKKLSACKNGGQECVECRSCEGNFFPTAHHPYLERIAFGFRQSDFAIQLFLYSMLVGSGQLTQAYYNVTPIRPIGSLYRHKAYDGGLVL